MSLPLLVRLPGFRCRFHKHFMAESYGCRKISILKTLHTTVNKNYIWNVPFIKDTSQVIISKVFISVAVVSFREPLEKKCPLADYKIHWK